MSTDDDGYEFDVFLSYRHLGDWTAFVNDPLQRLLHHCLSDAMGRDARIFVDLTGVAPGDTWPLRLAEAHSKSKVLIPLFNRGYFGSKPCQTELGLMLERESQLGLRSPADQHGLIFPLLISDGESIPDAIRHINYCDIRKCARSSMTRGTGLYRKLEEALAGFAEHVVVVLDRKIPCSPSWLTTEARDFAALSPQLQPQLLPTLE